MSQHHTYSNEIHLEEPDMTQHGYHGVPYSENYADASFGQKVFAQTRFSSPTPRQRLVLSLVSVILLLMAFCVAAIVMAMIPSQIVIPVPGPEGAITSVIKDNSVWQHTIGILLIVALAIVGTLIFSINLLFNSFYRKHENHV